MSCVGRMGRKYYARYTYLEPWHTKTSTDLNRLKHAFIGGEMTYAQLCTRNNHPNFARLFDLQDLPSRPKATRITPIQHINARPLLTANRNIMASKKMTHSISNLSQAKRMLIVRLFELDVFPLITRKVADVESDKVHTAGLDF